MRFFGVVMVTAGLAVMTAASEEKTTLYVAPNGNDAWSGGLAAPNADGTDGPLATLAGARDAVRRLDAAGAVNVLVREGTYRIEGPFVLGPEDSGSPQAPVTYAAYPGESPVISGGRPVTGWKQDGVLWTVELPEVRAGEWVFSALWVNGEMRRPARTPNEGFHYTAGKAPPLKNPDTDEDADRSKIAFKFNPGDIQHWTNLEDVLVSVMHSWDTSHHRIESIDDENNIVTFTAPVGWKFEHWGPKQRYFVENVFEGLDAPGEWYLDRKTGVLSYWPMDGEDMTTAEVVAPVAQQLVRFDGDLEQGAFVEFVTLRGLRFEHTDYTLGPKGQGNCQAAYPVHGAIHANGARFCAIEDCTVAHASNYAVWFQLGCTHNRLFRNHCTDLGAGGIRIGNGGDAKNDHEVTGRNVVDNNWLHDGGKIFPASVGVWIGRSSYNTVSHNDISDFFYTGVSVGWSWGYAESSANHNHIEYNHIHHLGKRLMSDMGGIYCLGAAPGTVLRYNLIHDVFSYTYGGWGIYPDEGSSDLLIENNVVYNCKTGTFHQHYGRENRIVNNIFAFSHEGQVIRSREEDHVSFFFERNIVYFNNGRLLGSNWGNGNFRLDNNCYWDTSGFEVEFAGKSLDEWQATGQDRRSIIADPLFRNVSEFDFRLDPDSPAITRLGFQPIDISGAGLYGSEEWVDGPKGIGHAASELPTVQPPEPLRDGFENTAVGEPPNGARVSGETDVARIRVTEEQAASGKRCLKITDAAGLEKGFNPHMYYEPHLRRGTVTGSLDLRVGPGAILYHEWRDGGNPYSVGPSIYVYGDGRVVANGNPVLQVPVDQWFHVEIRCGLGKNRTGTYALTITVAGQDPQTFADLPCGTPLFKKLDWIGLVANGTEPAEMFIDNVELAVK